VRDVPAYDLARRVDTQPRSEFPEKEKFEAQEYFIEKQQYNVRETT
jgi:hypothetical protein